MKHLVWLSFFVLLTSCGNKSNPTTLLSEEAFPVGKWETNCNPANMVEGVDIKSDGGLVLSLTLYTDATCTSKSFVMDRFFNYSYDDANTRLTTTALKLVVTAYDSAVFSDLAAMCPHATWQIGVPVDFASVGCDTTGMLFDDVINLSVVDDQHFTVLGNDYYKK